MTPRDRMIEKATEYSLGTYSRKFVAPVFQRLIRAEDAARPSGPTPVMVNGQLDDVLRLVGECVCVTCGKRAYWTGNRFQGMHTGHFLASRCNSILFEEDNVAPQCAHCNYYRDGEPQLFRTWMLSVRGEEVVERLEALKTTVVHFTREELVDKKIEYSDRLKAAEIILKGVHRG